MLFNSFNFSFIFLPIVVFTSIILKKYFHTQFLIIFLIISSLIFYSYYYPPYIFLIMCSIFFNYMSSYLLIKYNRKKINIYIFSITILVNLVILLYYKYFNFLAQNLSVIFTLNISEKELILPLAISFFTFQQIAFITSVYRKEISKVSFLKYSLFICFFPQLIAGPIVKFKEFCPQISLFNNNGSLNKANISLGLYIFCIGMLKKILISAYLASIADPIFDDLHNKVYLNASTVWIGLVAFSLQIYFDFSGYSDMAIGLALCFGIKLPYNFNSPYKASSLKEFWQKWHITLSRFLKEHIYFTLGGNKNKQTKTVFNILITMLIGGIWHGASWNFFIWGLYHGVLISIERILKNFIAIKPFILNRFFIFFIVTIGWIPFRCSDLITSEFMFDSLFFNEYLLNDKYKFSVFDFFIFGILLIITFFLPNSIKIQSFIKKNLINRKNNHYLLLLIIGVIFLMLSEPTNNINREFIYFQF